MAIHTCPRCELRFERESEVADHLITDHRFDPDALRPHLRPIRREGRKLIAVVGNHTLLADPIRDHLHELVASGAVDLHIVVPVRHDDELEIGFWRGRALAERIVSVAKDVVVTVDAGVEDPVHLVERSLQGAHADRIVLSTFPQAFSKWIEADIAGRLRHEIGVPVDVVIA
jgi:uncharacterized C2H2 Zn-finger protein